jgi:hypothetical protein
MSNGSRSAGNPKIGPLYTKLTEPRLDAGIDSPLRMFANPAITSQFRVSLHLSPVSGVPYSGLDVSGNAEYNKSLNQWLASCELLKDPLVVNRYDFLCSQASLPGSTLLSSNETGSFQGVMEEFPVRRAYSPFDMTFYVDRDYSIIRLFEEWLNFINPVNTKKGVITGSKDGHGNAKDSDNFFRLRYPKQYKRIISVTKFERDFVKLELNKMKLKSNLNTLTYRMIDAYPYNISSVPLTYEGSSIAIVVVSFKYSRYVTETTIVEKTY